MVRTVKVRPVEPVKRKSANAKSKTSCNTLSRLLIFRFLVFFSLFITASVGGFFTYWILYNQEHANYKNFYESISAQIHAAAQERLKRAQETGNELATMHSIYQPTKSHWPNAVLKGYDKIHQHTSKVANVITVGMAPIVEPEEVESFENYMRDIYQSPPYNLTSPNLDLGIFAFSANGPYRDTTGETPFSEKSLITPVLNIGNISRSQCALNFNLHSEQRRAEAIDLSYDCAFQTNGECSVLTDIIPFLHVGDGEAQPNSQIFRAVYPLENPKTLVGFQIVFISWHLLLMGIISDVVCGMDVVLATDMQKFTYNFCNGEVTLKCTGDCHQERFEEEGHFLPLQSIESGAELLIQPHPYTLEVFPSEVFYDRYHTNVPWICSVIVVVIIFFTSCIFILYDFFVKKDSHAREQVLEAKRRFVRFVSHEIRTPLNTLVLGLKLLLENVTLNVTDIAVRMNLIELSHELRGSCDVAVMVLNDLLQYDKIETGTLNLELKATRIWRLISRTVPLFRSSAREKGVTIMEQLTGVTGSEKLFHLGVNGDQLRLSQVIGNIISNALKFSPIGSTIIVKSEHHLGSQFPKQELKSNRKPKIRKSYEAQEWIVFSVQDQGPGISTENLRKLFGEGVQFNPNELQGGQGSGLGLWISKGIIELHGGRIWATSEGEGKGCTFFFELPLLELFEDSVLSSEDSLNLSVQVRTSAVSELESSPRIFSAGNSTKSFSTRIHQHEVRDLESDISRKTDNSKKILLIVDDVRLCRKMLARSLTWKGYECIEAENGKDCVNMMTEGAVVDCILMDFQMPVLSGPDATRELRRLGFTVPVVGVTGNVMNEDLQVFLDAGADMVMQKPFKMEIFEKFARENFRA